MNCEIVNHPGMKKTHEATRGTDDAFYVLSELGAISSNTILQGGTYIMYTVPDDSSRLSHRNRQAACASIPWAGKPSARCDTSGELRPGSYRFLDCRGFGAGSVLMVVVRASAGCIPVLRPRKVFPRALSKFAQQPDEPREASDDTDGHATLSWGNSAASWRYF